MGLSGCGGNSEVQLQEARKKAAHRKRRVILDDDGDLCYSDDAKKSVKAFLQQRLNPVLELPVDSIAWCIMWGIAIGKGETRYWETQQQNKPLNLVISDPTPIMVEGAREHKIELFGSMRMNDTHDSYGMPAGKLIYPLKAQHPEWLIGDESQKGKVFSSMEAATWSGLDFAVPEVREDRLWWIRNSVEKYDLAGLDLNFFRMPWYFKPGKEEEGLPLMTGLIRSARKVVDQASESKGRPVLLGVRTPGTVATCRRIGLDIETWLKEGLIDRLLIGGGYTAFNNPAEELVELGHRYEVPVYPCINCGTRIYGSDAAFRGAASNILWAGADGIYLWNFQYRKAPRISYGRPTAESYEVLNHIGSGDKLRYQDKRFAVDYVQVTSVLGNVGPYSYASHQGQVPTKLEDHSASEIRLRVGDDLATAESAGRLKQAELLLEIDRWSEGDILTASLNGDSLKSRGIKVAPIDDTESENRASQARFSVSASQVQQGVNQLRVETTLRDRSSPITLRKVELDVRYH